MRAVRTPPSCLTPHTMTDDIRTRVFNEIHNRMGRDFLLKTPPAVFDYDTAKLGKRARTEGRFTQLNRIYSQIPSVTCDGCGTTCCREAPDIYILEYLNIWRHIRLELRDPALEALIVARSLQWQFARETSGEIVYCPFLIDGRCSIYPVRSLSCRLWALEDQACYDSKAARALEFLEKKKQYFLTHGVTLPDNPAGRHLPKCDRIAVDGNRIYTEDEIVALDLEIAFLHLNLIPQPAFRSANFQIHFPGHFILKKISIDDIDPLSVLIARELIDSGASTALDSLISSFAGTLPA